MQRETRLECGLLDEIRTVIKQKDSMRKEDQNTEYKQSWREEYLKWICGFANAEGGRMLIGVADDKRDNEVVGVADWKTLLETIPNVMRDTMGMIAEVNHLKLKNKDVIEIVVPAYPVPISLRGVYYVRRGATNQRLSGPGLEAFLLRRRGLHWESLPCPRFKMKDVSAREIKRFKDLSIDKGRLDDSVRRESKEAFVTNLHLVAKDGLTYAAALLFSEKAEKWIPGAYVKVGMFGVDDADLMYHDDVHGSLLEQAEKTLDLIYFKYLKAKIWYENGEQRVEKFPFPKEGLRELIFNALVHKDYSSGIPIQISVYADRLYVANVGSLPESWTVETLMKKHVSRPANPTVAGCVYLTGKIETWGRGIEKVMLECRKHGCPQPHYTVNPGEPGDLMVCVRAAPNAIIEDAKAVERGDEAINEAINEAIRSAPGINKPKLVMLTGKSKATVERVLAKLVADGSIEHRGSKKTGGYYSR